MKTTLVILAAVVGLAGTASARHPDLRQPDPIKYIAHELEEAAHHVHEMAEAYAHHGGYREAHALKALHELDRQARHFHRQVERYDPDPYHTEDDYRALVRAYRQARRAIRHLHTYEHVYDDFHRVEVLMGELARYYRGHSYYQGHDDDHGYYGRRYGRRGRFGISLRWQYPR